MECWIWYLEITRDSNEDVNIKNLKVTTISDKYKTAAAGALSALVTLLV